MIKFHVQVVGADGIPLDEQVVEAGTAEHAAGLLIDEPLQRGARSAKKVLRAKVYWEGVGGRTMVRLFGLPPEHEGAGDEPNRLAR